MAKNCFLPVGPCTFLKLELRNNMDYCFFLIVFMSLTEYCSGEINGFG